uniref:Ammonium transporter AmtB-like domain-containing protein n=1 Tax=Magallana gigas TaxID=29159 RepID=A0A8W8N419_MAGGI
MTSRGDYSSTWVFIAGVILLQFGFVIREVGAVRIKDTKRIIIRHVVNLLLSGVVYCLFGVVLALSDGGVADKFIGTTFVFLYELIAYVFILTQSAFASITTSIVTGAIAERCKLIAYFITTVFISGFIHPVARHWTIYGRGWLNIEPIVYQDNAGSGTIHVVAGIAALVGAAMLGPRTGRFDSSLKKDFTERCYSARVAAVGGFILLIGFLAFIWGCRELFVFESSYAPIALSKVNPSASCFIAAITSLFINRYFGKKWSLFVAINGGLAGMVAISAGSDHFEPLRIDDPLDVVAVHFVGGSWGLIAVAIFHKTKGILYTWQTESAASILGYQLLGLVAIAVWTAVLSGLMFGILRWFGILRVCDEVQEKEFAHPAHEFMEIKKENEETVDITFNASPEKICQKDTYFAGDKASDFHL